MIYIAGCSVWLSRLLFSYETAPCILSFESPDKIAIGRRHQFNPTSVSSTIDYVEGYSHSPHPLVDAFIISCANKGGVQGGIRRWSYFQQGVLDYLTQHQL